MESDLMKIHLIKREIFDLIEELKKKYNCKEVCLHKETLILDKKYKFQIVNDNGIYKAEMIN